MTGLLVISGRIKPDRKLFKFWVQFVAPLMSFLTLSFLPYVIIILVYNFIYVRKRKLTDEGWEYYLYLKGLKKYISMAETERIKVLQGPDTAQKILVEQGIDVNDPVQLVKLNERLLPYAVLFRLENNWPIHLGDFYKLEAGDDPIRL